MRMLTTDELLQWPRPIMNDLVDRVFSKFRPQLQCYHFISAFKYLVLTDDKELKSKIVQMVEFFREEAQSRIKDEIWKLYFTEEK